MPRVSIETAMASAASSKRMTYEERETTNAKNPSGLVDPFEGWFRYDETRQVIEREFGDLNPDDLVVAFRLFSGRELRTKKAPGVVEAELRGICDVAKALQKQLIATDEQVLESM